MSDLKEKYSRRVESVLITIQPRLEKFIRESISDEPRIDRVSVRVKSVTSFLAKAGKILQSGEKKYNDPLNQIQDQIGARIVTFYKEDVERISARVNELYKAIEEKTIEPESVKEFGYFGSHFIFLLPSDVLEDDIADVDTPGIYELQVKTLYQHAWGEASHDLAYKAYEQLSQEQQRSVAFTAAQSWGADEIFSNLCHSLKTGEGETI